MQTKTNNIFEKITIAPVDPILGINQLYNKNTHLKKINLSIGTYRTDDGKSYILPIVRKIEKNIININKKYLPIDGMNSLKKVTQQLTFGQSSKNIASVQTLSGTGSLCICAEFIKKYIGCSKVYLSDPTWSNHKNIFKKVGIIPDFYPYWNTDTKTINCEEWIAHLNNVPDSSLYVIQPCAHNPTGTDPNDDQWNQIVATCKKKRHIIIIDNAYQGFASGDIEYDRRVIEMFFATGLQFFVCQSFSKNIGLYGERIGMLHIVCSNEYIANNVLSHIKLIIRAMYSSPPIHGALIVNEILSNNENLKQWKKELKSMSKRIQNMREILRMGLEKKRNTRYLETYN